MKGVTWYLIADGAKARIVTMKRRRQRNHVDVVKEFETEALPTREIMADRPGRAFDRVGSHRHAAEPQTDAHRLNKLRFAHQLRDYLSRAAHDDAYQALVVVAPPKTLGDLRTSLPEGVSRRVIATFPKDLTNLVPHNLAPHLNRLVA